MADSDTIPPPIVVDPTAAPVPIMITVQGDLVFQFGASLKVSQSLQRIENSLALLHTEGAAMTVELDNLKASVARMETAEASAVALMKGLAAQLTAIKDDPAAVQALADQINKDADDLGAAVVANTPAA